jgi:hypothetical protein
MAKKKKAKSTPKKKAKKKTAKKKPEYVVPWKEGNSLVTAFLNAFRLFLSKDDPEDSHQRLWRWPPAGEVRASSLDTVRDVHDMLDAAVVAGTPPPAGAPGTFLAEVAACVSAFPWPNSSCYKVKNGKPYGFPVPTVNLYEIGQVVDLMLQAINDGGDGGGGGGSRWPPVK